MSPREFERHEQVARLLRMAGLPPAIDIQALPGGRNNKVFRVETPECAVLFKVYFHHPEDPRDRLAHEFAFLRHLAARGSRFAAKPLACDSLHHVGLMEFLEGQRPVLEEVDAAHIAEAVSFFYESNSHITEEDRKYIPAASEACFSIDDHVAGTGRRVARLAQMLEDDDVDREAIAFVRDELIPFWQRLQTAVLQAAGPKGEDPILESERRLSPSDFGFHNSLRQADGMLKFLDFEYAGWDDPAKLIIDFANQPDMILPAPLEGIFRQAAIDNAPDPERLRRRVGLLEPVYQTKWACILSLIHI